MVRAKDGREGTRRTITRSGVQLKWTFDMKQALDILFTDFELSRATREAAFNRLYAQHIRDCGFTEWVPYQRLSAQNGMRGPPEGPARNSDWARIRAGPRTPAEEANRQRLKDEIAALVSKQQSGTHPAADMKHRVPNPSQPALPPRRHTSIPSMPTPLSNRAPIAHWHPETPDPKIPQSPESNQVEVAVSRRLPTLRIASAAEASHTSAKTQSATPKRRRKLAAPQTPKTPRSVKPRFPIFRADGKSMMRTLDQIRDHTVHVNSVPEHKAKPPLPALLLRYYNEETGSTMNTKHGFVARKYHESNIVSHIVPKSYTIDPTDIFFHFDRKMDKSPYISTSSRLIWIVHLLLKNLKAGHQHGRVAMISTRHLDKRTVFYARPFHDELVKAAPFSNGAQNYHGTYEFLCWRDIPGHAIIHTWKVAEFLDLVESNKAIRTALHFDIMSLPRRALGNTKIPMMKTKGVRLNSELTVAIAQLCLFFGLNAHSPTEQLSHIVTDIIEGWNLKVEYRTEVQWLHLADLFADAICQASTKRIEYKNREKVKLAFLDGVAWGCGEVNARFKLETIAAKDKKAQAVGLASPARILTAQLDATKLALMSYEMMQNQRLKTYHQQTITNGQASDDGDEMDVDMGDNVHIALSFQPPTPSSGERSRGSEDGVAREDEDAQEDSDGDYVIRLDDDELVF